jgi:hypothetical protein
MSGTAKDITRMKRDAEAARARLSSTLGALQYRLRPGRIASNAWEGVKDKGTGIADDAVQAVKARPRIVSGVLAGFTLFLARKPLKSAVSRLFSRSGDDDDLITTRIDGGTENYDLTAPLAARSQIEGVSA